jgi:hypothetical protein
MPTCWMTAALENSKTHDIAATMENFACGLLYLVFHVFFSEVCRFACLSVFEILLVVSGYIFISTLIVFFFATDFFLGKFV